MTLWKCLGRLAPFWRGPFCREHPFDAGACSISLSFPSGDFAAQSRGLVDPASEALSPQDADLDLNHVKRVLGGVAELDPPQDPHWLGFRTDPELASLVGSEVSRHFAVSATTSRNRLQHHSATAEQWCPSSATVAHQSLPLRYRRCSDVDVRSSAGVHC